MTNSSLEYTMEATSNEEGIAVNLPLPSSSSLSLAAAAAPTTLPLAAASAVAVPSFSTDLMHDEVNIDERREANAYRKVDCHSRTTLDTDESMVEIANDNNHKDNNNGDGRSGDYYIDNNGHDNNISNNGHIELAAMLPLSPLAVPTESSTLRTTTPSTSSYYTTPPKQPSWLCLPYSLSFSQRLREYRHNYCIMTPISFLVLSAFLLSSLITLIFTIPQFLLGLFLGPFLKRSFWLVEFLYRFHVAKWGHLKIMAMAIKGKNKGSKGNSNVGGLSGHSSTLQQRMTVVPNRVYIHPIPQFTDNIAYLVVCTPPPPSPTATATTTPANVLPLIAILIDCGEASKIMQYMERIYEKYYSKDYPLSTSNNDNDNNARSRSTTSLGSDDHHNDNGAQQQLRRRTGMELYAVLCTHRHHDHTAGVGDLKKDLITIRKEGSNKEGANVDYFVGTGCAATERQGNNILEGRYEGKVTTDQQQPNNIYQKAQGNLLVVGGAVEQVPHCNLYAKNGCFVPLPCISLIDEDNNNGEVMVNDMNALVSVEVIGVPSHTRGSVVYALRNRVAPGIPIPIGGTMNDAVATTNTPLQSHLFTGDAIFTGGGGVPFEADLEFASDNFVKDPKSLRGKNGSSSFRPGAGTLSLERCFAEVLSRVEGPWWWNSSSSSSTLPQDVSTDESTSRTTTTTTNKTALLYPGHEYTTDLLMRQFDQKTIPNEGYWTRLSPSVFFTTASHYLVSAHRRGLPSGQKLLTVPTPLDREQVVNPNFRSLKRRGEAVVNALRFWYEFGSKNVIPDRIEEDGVPVSGAILNDANEGEKQLQSIFTTVYSADLDRVVRDLRSGNVTASLAADRIESLQSRLDDKVIGRRPIPSTLPSHKNVYVGVVAMAVLGSAPSAVTVSDANIMGMAPPVDSTDRIIISKRRLIAVLDGLGLLAHDTSPRLLDIIHLLWQEARLDSDLNLDIEHPNSRDVECSLKIEDQIELGLLKLALFGVAFNQPSKFCLPCGGSRKPKYVEQSWVTTSKLRRTSGELVRHDPETCLLCRDVLRKCPYSVK